MNEEKCWRALTLEARAAVAALLTTAQTFRRPYCDRFNHVKRVTGDGRVHQRLCHRRVSSSVCNHQSAEFLVAPIRARGRMGLMTLTLVYKD